VFEGDRRIAAGEPIYRADALSRRPPASVRQRRDRRLLPLIEEHLRHDLALDPHQLTTVVTQHRQIFEAVKRRDGDAAQRLTHAHLPRYFPRRSSSSAVEAMADGGRGDAGAVTRS
jgi:DNA-binding GntR family transcriptional regulator